MLHAIRGSLHAAILIVGMQAWPLQSIVIWSVWIFLTIQHLSVSGCSAMHLPRGCNQDTHQAEAYLVMYGFDKSCRDCHLHLLPSLWKALDGWSKILVLLFKVIQTRQRNHHILECPGLQVT